MLQYASESSPTMFKWALIIFKKVLLPIIMLFVVYAVMRVAYKLIMKLYISGKANEWVLILNNGKLKNSGVGLSCFCSPFDQVARIPA